MIEDLYNILEELKSRVDIVDVVSDTVKLRRTGSGKSVGLCPFHSESDGSLGVDQKKQLFYCYGCQTGGDVVTWVRELEGLAFWPALRKLAARVGMQLPEPIHTRMAAPPPLEIPELPATYRSHDFAVLVEPGTRLDGIESPFVRLGEPTLTIRAALRLEKLHHRICLVYTDEEDAMQSVRNVYAACRHLSLYLRHVPEEDSARQLVFREWPHELWRKSTPGVLALIRYELERLGFVSGSAAVLSVCRGPSWQRSMLWQHIMTKACGDNSDAVSTKPEEEEIPNPLLALFPQVSEDEEEPAPAGVMSAVWDL